MAKKMITEQLLEGSAMNLMYLNQILIEKGAEKNEFPIKNIYDIAGALFQINEYFKKMYLVHQQGEKQKKANEAKELGSAVTSLLMSNIKKEEKDWVLETAPKVLKLKGEEHEDDNSVDS